MSPAEIQPTLERVGWRNYQTGKPPAGLVGRVRRVDRGESDVITEKGEIRALSDSMRAQSDVAPATGDWVVLQEDGELGTVIDQVLPRRSAIVRRDPAEEVVEQVMVANVDVVGVVAGVDRPLNVARLERLLVLAADSGAKPVIVLSKVDLGVSSEWDTLERQMGDVPIVRTSAETGAGVDQIRAMIRDDHTLVLLGESGCGKSTLVNALVGEEVQETSQVRARDAKGRHTTTARELLVVPGGGVIIDTPGIRGVGLWDAEPAVARVFADITELADGCRFGDCSHRVEPGCAVRAAVDDGTLDPRRVERYLRLRAELDEQAEMFEQRRRKPQGRPAPKRRGRRRRR